MKRAALIIGINQYGARSGLAPLKYAEADARDLATVLCQVCGFDTTVLCGAEATRLAIEEAATTCGSGDTFLFFFAGHGQLVKGQYILHPVDSKASGVGALPFEFFAREWQSDFGYEQVLAVLDACRNEAARMRGSGSRGFSAAESRDIVAATQDRRWVEVLYGCSEGQVSYEEDALGHGVFTHALLRTLQETRDYLDADHLAGATADYMEEWCQADEAGRWQVAHRYHVPSLKRKLTLVGEMPSGKPALECVKCPACGRRSAEADTFECRQCGRNYLCERHFVEARNCCQDCAAKQEAAEHAAKEKAEKLQRELAEVERKDREETERQAEAARRRAEAERQIQVRREREVTERKPGLAQAVCRKMVAAVSLSREAVARRKNLAYASKELPCKNSLGMRFVPVPGTSVLFCVWETRVRDHRAFVQATNRSWDEPDFKQSSDHPAVNVSWEDAKDFCQWLTEKERAGGRLPVSHSYRLPTDEEWSWAVGIGDLEGKGTAKQKGTMLKGIYPWGTQWPPPKGAGNYGQNVGVDDYEYTSPVGSFAANRHGLYDLGGNVWEWCEDFFDGDRGTRVLRGASWGDVSLDCLLSSYRYNCGPHSWHVSHGFRVVLAGGDPAVDTAGDS